MNISKSIFLTKFYPWLICVSGLFILVVINGLTTTVITVFDKSLINEFHWTRSELKARDALPNFISFFFILLSGTLMDKFRVKKMMLFGTAILCISLASYSFITSKFEAYFLHVLFGVAYITSGSVATIILVSTWFREFKGLALGITLAGTSLGGIFLPNLIGHWIDHYSWREAFLYLSFFPAILFFYIVFVIKSSPSDLGIKPFGFSTQQLENENLLMEGLSYHDATKSQTFWLICFSGFLSFYSVVGIVSNLILHTLDLGFDKTTARYALSIYFLVAFIGKLLVATLGDFFDNFKVFTLCCIVLTIGCIGLYTMNADTLFIYIGLIGFSWGGIYSMYNVLTVKTFGLKSAGKINGTISMFESAGAFLGPIITGYIYDKTHSYQNAFLLIILLMVIAVLISLKFRKASLQTVS